METDDTMDRASYDNADSDLSCPQCGAKSVTTFWYHDTFNYGSGAAAVTLNVDLPVRRCTACDFEFLDHEGERIRHEAVCRHLGVLTPTEVRAVRERHGMTRAVFAQVTGLGEATLNRWENGLVVQNRANDRFLRLLAAPECTASFPSYLRVPATEMFKLIDGNDSEPPRFISQT